MNNKEYNEAVKRNNPKYKAIKEAIKIRGKELKLLNKRQHALVQYANLPTVNNRNNLLKIIGKISELPPVNTLKVMKIIESVEPEWVEEES